MSALAQYLLNRGYVVSGSDLTSSALTDKLATLGATIHIGHSASNLPDDVNYCVYTSAIPADNCELLFCKASGIPLIKRESLLGKIFNAYPDGIAVSGAHGKTTTTALLLTAFNSCERFPTAFVGGIIEKRGNFISGDENTVIAEACEYKASFLKLKPTVSVILNIDLDHLDYYRQLKDIENAFNRFAKRSREGGAVVYNGDDVPYYVLNGVNRKLITYGFNKNCDFVACNLRQTLGKYSCDVFKQGSYYCSLSLQLRGKHNIYNALATLAVTDYYHLSVARVATAISDFAGTQRRWMVVNNGFTNIVEDYAHHPNEIRAVVATALLQGYRRVYVAFQPHTYSRTYKLFSDFCTCFDGVDKLFLLPIYAAREQPIEGVSSAELSARINDIGKVDCKSLTNFADCAEEIKKIATPDDLVLIMGAGDINQVSALLKSDKT